MQPRPAVRTGLYFLAPDNEHRRRNGDEDQQQQGAEHSHHEHETRDALVTCTRGGTGRDELVCAAWRAFAAHSCPGGGCDTRTAILDDCAQLLHLLHRHVP